MYKVEVEMHDYTPPFFIFFRTFEDAVKYVQTNISGIFYNDEEDKYDFEAMKETKAEKHEDSLSIIGIPYTEDDAQKDGDPDFWDWLSKYPQHIYVKEYEFNPEKDEFYILTYCTGYNSWLFHEDEQPEHLKCFNTEEEGIQYVDNILSEYEVKLDQWNKDHPNPSLMEREYRPHYPFATEHFAWKETCGFYPGDKWVWRGCHLRFVHHIIGERCYENSTSY